MNNILKLLGGCSPTNDKGQAIDPVSFEQIPLNRRITVTVNGTMFCFDSLYFWGKMIGTNIFQKGLAFSNNFWEMNGYDILGNPMRGIKNPNTNIVFTQMEMSEIQDQLTLSNFHIKTINVDNLLKFQNGWFSFTKTIDLNLIFEFKFKIVRFVMDNFAPGKQLKAILLPTNFINYIILSNSFNVGIFEAEDEKGSWAVSYN